MEVLAKLSSFVKAIFFIWRIMLTMWLLHGFPRRANRRLARFFKRWPDDTNFLMLNEMLLWFSLDKGMYAVALEAGERCLATPITELEYKQYYALPTKTSHQEVHPKFSISLQTIQEAVQELRAMQEAKRLGAEGSGDADDARVQWSEDARPQWSLLAMLFAVVFLLKAIVASVSAMDDLPFVSGTWGPFKAVSALVFYCIIIYFAVRSIRTYEFPWQGRAFFIFLFASLVLHWLNGAFVFPTATGLVLVWAYTLMMILAVGLIRAAR